MRLLELPPTIGLPGSGRVASSHPIGYRPLAGINPRWPAFVACRDITRASARNFYLGLRLAPEPRRSALLAVYAWMRHADDLADAGSPSDTPATRAAALAEFRVRTAAALDQRARSMSTVETGASAFGRDEGRAPQHSRESTTAPIGCEAWWPAFERTMRAHAIPDSVFFDTLDALDADARGVGLATTADLARYCDRVAGTVALACVCIWGLRRSDAAPRVYELAIRRARAVQLTNILRDLPEDLLFEPRRSYLPKDSFARYGVTPEALLDPAASGEARARAATMLDHWIMQARELYDASRDLESLIDPSCARVSWALSAVYRSLLDSIARDPARARRQRVSVTRPRKLSIALAGWLGVGLPG